MLNSIAQNAETALIPVYDFCMFPCAGFNFTPIGFRQSPVQISWASDKPQFSDLACFQYKRSTNLNKYKQSGK